MRIVSVLILCLLPLAAGAQTRIALDFSTRGNQILPSFVFLKVFRPGYYVKAGISAGTFGAGEKEGQIIGSGSGYMNNEYEAIESSYKPINFPQDTMAKLVYYKEWNRGVALDGGIGRFFAFGLNHTLRIDLQLKAYFLKSLVVADYDPLHNSGKDYSYVHSYRHFALSLGPEIFHAIRLGDRLTGYYGFKIPVFLPFETKNYQRLEGPSPVKGIKPFFTVGMSCGIGRKKPAAEE